MWTLIFYAVAGVAVLAALHGFDVSRQNIGKEDQRKIDEPIIKAAEKARDTAVAANAQLQNDLAVLDAQRKACNEAVLRIQETGKRTTIAVAARKPRDDQKLAVISADKEALVVALGLPVAGTCEQRLAQRDALWQKIAEQRARDFPPTGAPVPDQDAVVIKPRPR